jgi:hypothetical protein
MFRSSTIIRELTLNLAKIIFMLEHSVKLRRYLLCGCVAACHAIACVLHAVQNAQHVTCKTLHLEENVNLRTVASNGHSHGSVFTDDNLPSWCKQYSCFVLRF